MTSIDFGEQAIDHLLFLQTNSHKIWKIQKLIANWNHNNLKVLSVHVFSQVFDKFNNDIN